MSSDARKVRLPLPNKNRMVVGKGKLSNSSLLVANKLTWTFVTRFDVSVGVDDILSHLENTFKDKSIFKCEKLVPRHNSYASFKIGAPIHMEKDLMDSDNWPQGILIGKYYPSKSSVKSDTNKLTLHDKQNPVHDSRPSDFLVDPVLNTGNP